MANTKVTAKVIADGTITATQLASDSVTSAKIADNVALGGSPTTTTQSASDNSTKVATTAYVETAISNLIDSAPGTLNTLNELAAALGDDASFSTTITNSIATKMPLAGGTFTGDVSIVKSGNPSFTVKTTGAGNNPFLKLQADTNYWEILGIFSNSDDDLDIRYNGTSKLAVNNGGDTTIAGDLTVDTNVLHVNSTNNNVGIGDANPPSNTKLAIQADGIGLRLDGTADTTRTIFFRSTTSSNPAQIYADGSLLIRTEDANTDIRFQVNDDEKLRIGTNGYLVAQSASQVRLVLGSTGNSTNNTSNWVRGSGSEMDFNSASGGYNWEVGGNKKMRLAASGKLGVGTTPVADPQHELVVHADSNPTIAIIGDGYNDDISIRFGGGDLTSSLGDGNSGAAIHSTQSVANGEAKGDLRFKINKGDSLQTALTITNSQSVAVSGSGAAGHSFEVQDKTDGYSTFWSGRSSSGEGRGLTASYGLMGVNSTQYDGDGATYPIAGIGGAADNASHESVDFWFGSTTSEWQPMVFMCIGAHTSGGQTGQTAGWALIRATHYNNGVSFNIMDSGGGGTWTTSVQGSFGDDRTNTSRCRITYSGSQNRTVLSVWGANYSSFYGATRA